MRALSPSARSLLSRALRIFSFRCARSAALAEGEDLRGDEDKEECEEVSGQGRKDSQEATISRMTAAGLLDDIFCRLQEGGHVAFESHSRVSSLEFKAGKGLDLSWTSPGLELDIAYPGPNGFCFARAALRFTRRVSRRVLRNQIATSPFNLSSGARSKFTIFLDS